MYCIYALETIPKTCECNTNSSHVCQFQTKRLLKLRWLIGTPLLSIFSIRKDLSQTVDPYTESFIQNIVKKGKENSLFWEKM